MRKVNYCCLILSVVLMGTYVNAGTISPWECSAGSLYGLDNDYINEINSELYQLIEYTASSDGVIHMMLDLEEVKDVDKILYTNRYNVATNLVAKNVDILVASDESSASFDPYLLSSYTDSVYSGNFLPLSNEANLEREIDITDVSKRYLLINFNSNLSGVISSTNSQIQVTDIGLVTVPEPATLALVGFGGTLIAIRSKKKRNKF